MKYKTPKSCPKCGGTKINSEPSGQYMMTWCLDCNDFILTKLEAKPMRWRNIVPIDGIINAEWETVACVDNEGDVFVILQSGEIKMEFDPGDFDPNSPECMFQYLE